MYQINYLLIKCIDKILAITTLFLLSPVFISTAIILKFTGEGEILFKQTRIGKNRKKIQIIKFVTMLKNSPTTGSGELTLPEDDRVLPVGRFLRRSKINELPQVINVLFGDMSLIGPRPQTAHFSNCFDTKDLETIYSTQPGLSGIGSLIFRNEEDIFKKVDNPKYWDEEVIMPYKGRLECWYVENYSFKNYILLLILTLIEIVAPRRVDPLTIFNNLPLPPPLLAEKLGR